MIQRFSCSRACLLALLTVVLTAVVAVGLLQDGSSRIPEREVFNGQPAGNLPAGNLPAGRQPPGFRFPDTEHFFLTDCGSQVPVFNWVTDAEAYEAYAEWIHLEYCQRYELIVTSAPTPRTNCHGWVFLRGQYLLFGEQVEQILEDNGYLEVFQPRPGDLIIYRDAAGNILHSGLVWEYAADGGLLIQSKFGISGCYLHAPEEQPYGERFSFYRTDRRRHAVRIRAMETAVQP